MGQYSRLAYYSKMAAVAMPQSDFKQCITLQILGFSKYVAVDFNENGTHERPSALFNH